MSLDVTAAYQEISAEVNASAEAGGFQALVNHETGQMMNANVPFAGMLAATMQMEGIDTSGIGYEGTGNDEIVHTAVTDATVADDRLEELARGDGGQGVA